MYAEWPSIEDDVVGKCQSVLHSYPPAIGKDVAKTVINSLYVNLPNAFPSNQRSSSSTNILTLTTHSDVNWTMEVLCYSLTLPLTDGETLKESVSIYIDWLSVASSPKPNVPEPICNDPLPYLRIMISHLENLFIPKSEGGNPSQLALCQNVLKAIQTVAHEGINVDRDTWEALLKFVLNVSNTLLSPPSFPNGLAEQMCEQLMQALFDVWMLACHLCFPTPSFWKTFQILFSNWRHHPPVVEWWSKITAALTSRLLTFMYGSDFPKFKVSDDTAKYVPKGMDNEHIAQTWFRILHLIKDPVELSNPNLISKTPAFREQLAMIDPSQHPCLRMLPYIFLKAMKGVSSFVDAFLGLPTEKKFEVIYPNLLQQIATPITPTSVRKSGKVKKGAPNPTSKAASSSPAGASLSSTTVNVPGTSPTSNWSSSAVSLIDMHPLPTLLRPQCNSIMHLFGKWLLDAALASCKFDSQGAESRPRSQSIFNLSSSQGALGFAPLGDNLVSNPMFDTSEFPESSDAGRAEACGTLCRLMCSKKTREHILPVYLSRFYLVVSRGLLGDSKQVLASILLNSVDLMRIDLPGATCLLSPLLDALKSILPDKQLLQFKPYINPVVLRRASIHLLMSMLPLPLHYANLELKNIEELWNSAANSGMQNLPKTFESHRERLLQLLIGALQSEDDPVNTQMILGALLLAVHDSALFELPEQEHASFDEKNFPSEQTDQYKSVPFDTSYGLYHQTIKIVSEKLKDWKSDLSVSLAALELLSGLAKARINKPYQRDCRDAVANLCQYIVQQCERPPPQHKRELHSMIVTAFHTLATWLLEHPYLLKEKDCLNEVLEIIELGISGSKSKPAQADQNQSQPVMKTNKELSPVSKRVMEAAEDLLILVFKHIGAFPTPCSPSTMSSLLDECSLLFHTSCGDLSVIAQPTEDFNNKYSMQNAVKHFRYFGLHNNMLLSILEQNLGNEQEPVPTVTVLIRNPAGRQVWTLQLRQTPRNDKLSPGAYLARPNRPSPLSEVKTYQRPNFRYFPEEVDLIPPVKADLSIPPLNEVPSPEQAPLVKKMHEFIEQQKKYDEDIAKYVEENPGKMSECVPQPPSQEFQTARLLLSHLNLLTLDSVKAKPQARLGPDLVMIDTSEASFASDLKSFDLMPTRNHDTVFIFYLKARQTEKEEILDNVSGSSKIQSAFSEFLLSLGWPVDVTKHPGWSGKVSTSWKLKDQFHKNKETIDIGKDGPGIFNGDRYILYYADATTEVAFVVPTLHSPVPVRATSPSREKKDRTRLNLDIPAARAITTRQDSPSSPIGGKPDRPQAQRTSPQSGIDTRVVVVWCEDYDSFESFSLDQFESEMATEESNLPVKSKDALTALLIHPLESGLFRIHIHTHSNGKMGVSMPLVSGTVASRRVLGASVRMTAMNICSRRRLASDSYLTPHVRRKQRINELLSKYQRRCTEPEFFTAMFTGNRTGDDLSAGVNPSTSPPT